MQMAVTNDNDQNTEDDDNVMMITLKGMKRIPQMTAIVIMTTLTLKITVRTKGKLQQLQECSQNTILFRGVQSEYCHSQGCEIWPF